MSGTACYRDAAPTLSPLGRIDDPRLSESSGVAVSRVHENVMWSHNDDGQPLVFALRFTGEAIQRYEVPGVENHDWEDISSDNSGNLYIYDNTARMQDPLIGYIYAFPEPDPFVDQEIETVTTYPIRFPDPGLDVETLIVRDSSAFLVSKPWDGSLPRIYFVESLEEGTAEFLGTIPHRAMITGGDISADGDRVALSSYRALFIFERKKAGEEPLRSEPLVCQLNAGQVEGISWDGDNLLLTSEQGNTFLVPESNWRNRKAPFLDSPLVEVPRIEQRPSVESPLSEWKSGVRILAEEGIGKQPVEARLAWSEVGFHVGIELPWDLTIAPLSEEPPKDLDHWFEPGRVYLMLNPTGDRPTDYSENDRCIVIGRFDDGRVGGEARFLRPATVIEHRELKPDWLTVEEEGQRLLITVLKETPGMEALGQGREIGFNLLILGRDGERISWVPLTTLFSWDAPSLWGTVRLEK
ncbi:MAG TPA: hypothetical protein VMY18_07155 [Acidobacteriota bacterium]|nr:hypothetical protein [Acidobacteriota bacterium]